MSSLGNASRACLLPRRLEQEPAVVEARKKEVLARRMQEHAESVLAAAKGNPDVHHLMCESGARVLDLILVLHHALGNPCRPLTRMVQ